MDRRNFNKVSLLATLGATVPFSRAQSINSDSRSGQNSPASDSDRLTPSSGEEVSLEDEAVRIAFDKQSGALLDFVNKRTGWKIQQDPKLAESFRIFAPTPDRSYNPIIGARNRVQSIVKSGNGKSIAIIWGSLRSELNGILDITLTASVTLDNGTVHFDMTVKNASPLTISSVDWPVIGALGRPASSPTLRRLTIGFGTGHELNLYPRFEGERGYFGTDFPTQIGDGRYNLVLAEREGLYLGKHDRTGGSFARYSMELKPGYSNSRSLQVPRGDQVDGHPVRITTSVQHFPFISPGEVIALPRVVLAPFEGDWHKGADIYRRWFEGWYERPSQPEWLGSPHIWQQLQIASSEDDIRTRYVDLPARVAQSAKDGIKALQLTGWNKGGQDRGNPSHDTDPRLGTIDELRSAIRKIEEMGIRVILFNKYVWADTSTEWYKRELYQYMAVDPNGIIYRFGGYRYQTPEQLADINTRRFATACFNNKNWLDICCREFQKSIDLGASGILFDECEHHGVANFCFSHDHGHRSPAALSAGDLRLGKIFRDQVHHSVGEHKFLMAGEALYDLETECYSLSYIRLVGEHIPVSRYNDPRAEIMVAVPGFDDREMINSALQYRYIMSFEPFNLKGDVDDYPLTMAYGQTMEAFRIQYRDFVWDGEFRDNQDATVMSGNKEYRRFSVFRRKDGKRAAVIVNNGQIPIVATLRFDGIEASKLSWASPQDPTPHPSDGLFHIAAESVVLAMET